MIFSRQSRFVSPQRGLLVLAAVLCCAGATLPAQDGRKFLAGNSKALWLVNADANTYDLLSRSRGGKWKFQDRKVNGTVTAACADDGALHLLFRDGAHLVYGPDGNYRPLSALNLPQNASPLAACGAVDFAGKSGPSLIVVARRPAGHTRPASSASMPMQAASAPIQTAKLAAYQSASDGWNMLAEWDQAPLPADGTAHVAVLDKTLYLLVSSADGREKHLLTWQGGKTGKASLEGLPTSARPSALLADEKQLLLVFAQSDANASSASLQIASTSNPMEGFAQPCQPVAMDGKAVTVPAASPVLASRAGSQLALLWRNGPNWQIVACDTSGRSGMTETVAMPEPSASGENAQNILSYFFWILVIATLPLWILSPRGFRPILLPATLQPARLPRRLLAGILDFLPFAMLQGVVLSILLPRMGLHENLVLNNAEFMEKLRELSMSEPVVYCYIGAMTCYTMYGAVMEKLLGATLGKKLMGLQTVDDTGGPLSWRAAILRNLMRTIELSSLTLPILLLWPLLNRYRLRMGDMLARTIVVEKAILPPGFYPFGDERDRHVPPRQDDDVR